MSVGAPRVSGKGKDKGLAITGHEGPEGGQMYSSTLPSTLALDGGVGGQRHAPAALPPGERPGTHCIGGWVGLRAGLDGCGKSRPPPGFDPRTVQAVASRYMDCVILAPAQRVLVLTLKMCWNKRSNAR